MKKYKALILYETGLVTVGEAMDMINHCYSD